MACAKGDNTAPSARRVEINMPRGAAQRKRAGLGTQSARVAIIICIIHFNK